MICAVPLLLAFDGASHHTATLNKNCIKSSNAISRSCLMFRSNHPNTLQSTCLTTSNKLLGSSVGFLSGSFGHLFHHAASTTSLPFNNTSTLVSNYSEYWSST
ncbi:hypothetical protein NPIL_694741 [Nephila pilipes]|uniref:Uncharacterized protein n=1 Tax=Nephila pilipes TaxID=299642 RepID=A0A8X6PAK2_NEPPI|nr:hypothetical protein NPIL_694741 [Nephila pilipes]